MICQSLRKEVPFPDAQTTWIDAEHGIRRNEEFYRNDTRTTLQKIQDIAIVSAREVSYACNTASKRLANKKIKHQFPKFEDDQPLGKGGSKGLIIFFHGINGDPCAWDEHLAQLTQYSAIDFFAPELPNSGHCKTNDPACRKLLNRVVNWTKQNPGMPVALFGQSNGSRFAVKFETWLRKHAPKVPVHVSLTGAVLYGSSRIDQLIRLSTAEHLETLSKGFLSTTCCEELAHGNPNGKKLLKKARAPLAEGVADRDYVMYASLYDTHVPEHGSCLPILNPAKHPNFRERHYVFTDWGHNAIVKAAVTPQISECLTWMDKHRA